MIDVNSYFDGKVKSLALDGRAKEQTLGVMEPGEYTFGTQNRELMQVVVGALRVQLPGEEEWRTVSAGESFEVEAGVTFEVEAVEPTGYLCTYG